MQIRLEPNQRFGYGLQIRFVGGPYCEVYDDEPLSPLEAMRSIQETIDMMNQEEGTAYKLSKISIDKCTQGAL